VGDEKGEIRSKRLEARGKRQGMRGKSRKNITRKEYLVLH